VRLSVVSNVAPLRAKIGLRQSAVSRATKNMSASILDSLEELSPGQRRECASFPVATLEPAGQIARARTARPRPQLWTAKAEVQRFDGRRNDKRALLVSPPPRGAECPSPVLAEMLGRGRPKLWAPSRAVPI
jgi:hypothetical protein